MPAPSSTKRIRGLQIHRPFLFGSEAIPFDPNNRPPNAPADHTHRWRVFVRGVPLPPSSTDIPQSSKSTAASIAYPPPNALGESHAFSPSTSPHTTSLTPWLKKVQFKLHDTYAQSVRTIEAPGPFEVEETGWGEFEIAIKFYFVAEAGEKAVQTWHALKLHPYSRVAGAPLELEEVQRMKRERVLVRSVCFEEVVFSEPSEAFYARLIAGAGEGGQAVVGAKKKGKGTGGKAQGNGGVDRRVTAEIPERSEVKNGVLWSREEEGKELDRLAEAARKIEALIEEEKEGLRREEMKLMELQETEGKAVKKK